MAPRKQNIIRTIKKTVKAGIPLAKKLMKHQTSVRQPLHNVDRHIRQKLNPKLASVGKIMDTSHALSYAYKAARGKTRK